MPGRGEDEGGLGDRPKGWGSDVMSWQGTLGRSIGPLFEDCLNSTKLSPKGPIVHQYTVMRALAIFFKMQVEDLMHPGLGDLTWFPFLGCATA